MQISLLFGTETGNTEMLCDDLQAELEADHDVDVANLQDVNPSDLDPTRFYVFVCSTYGEGELPQSAIPFVETLESDNPNLAQIKFSMFGFGDSSYEETYNQGSNVLANSLTKAGATMLGPRGLHDASGLDDAEEIAFPWIQERITEAQATFT